MNALYRLWLRFLLAWTERDLVFLDHQIARMRADRADWEGRAEALRREIMHLELT